MWFFLEGVGSKTWRDACVKSDSEAQKQTTELVCVFFLRSFRTSQYRQNTGIQPFVTLDKSTKRAIVWMLRGVSQSASNLGL